jgi:hypothetical protein
MNILFLHRSFAGRLRYLGALRASDLPKRVVIIDERDGAEATECNPCERRHALGIPTSANQPNLRLTT